MIITMQDTETREISAKIDELHEERGEAALGRVLTLLISPVIPAAKDDIVGDTLAPTLIRVNAVLGVLSHELGDGRRRQPLHLGAVLGDLIGH